MGHHLDSHGRFQSDKHDLPPDRIRLNLENINSYRALMQLADDYDAVDSELSGDLRKRLSKLHPDQHKWPALNHGAPSFVTCTNCAASLNLKRWFDASGNLRIRPVAPYPLPTCGE